MSGLNKVQTSNHLKALSLLDKASLSDDEKQFVFKHYQASATHLHKKAGAFFTPLEMAWDFSLNLEDFVSVIDLCAGIGALAFQTLKRNSLDDFRLVCVEINEEYVEVGKKLVPEAEWYCLDVMDLPALKQLGTFGAAMANPPFNSVQTLKDKSAIHYTGAHAEYKVIDVASQLAEWGFFILPQTSAGFEYSGAHHYRRVTNDKYDKFKQDTGLEINIGVSIDTTSCCDEEGEPVKDHFPVTVEFAEVDFENAKHRTSTDPQCDLFAVA